MRKAAHPARRDERQSSLFVASGSGERRYFQPASRLQAFCSRSWVFSHCVIERVSLLSILLFMQVQYFSSTSCFAPSFLLSLTHWLIHFTSSVVAARAGLHRIAGGSKKQRRCRDRHGFHRGFSKVSPERR